MEKPMQTPRIANRSTHHLKPCLLALGGFVLAGLFAATPAQAQCNSSANPPPAAGVTANYANQSFGPGVPYNVVNNGIAGCAGTDSGSDEDGGAGFAGQGAGNISTSATNVTIAGASVSQPLEYSYGLQVVALGGTGGNGGAAGEPYFNDVRGGAAGAGGAGARIDLNFTGSIGADAQGQLAEIGMYVVAIGGRGGLGGTTGENDMWGKTGGKGGAGGAGGVINLSGSGDITVGDTAIQAWADGGDGFSGGSVPYTSDKINDLNGGEGGAGGAGGSTMIRWDGGTITAVDGGLFATAGGGTGGAGGSTGYALENKGGVGGAGGAGGTATAILANGSVRISAVDRPFAGGIVASAFGGIGGVGGSTEYAVGATGGSGGNGGAGGTASATILGNVDVTSTAALSLASVYVNANGGVGGTGGGSSSVVGESGAGGFAGAGGHATLTVGSTAQGGNITASGGLNSAALVQSVGGGGGGGGQASFGADGGRGAAGGDGGTVVANVVNGNVVAHGASASALIAQSVGGSGGVGGNAVGGGPIQSIAIGGDGAVGGNGGVVDVTLDAPSIIGSLDLLGDGGVLAQSIGGAGGAGGSATAVGDALFKLTVGGKGGQGGVGGTVSVVSSALISSYGDHAAGIHAQSIGGGGGKGGAATIFGVQAVPSVSVAVGGNGGVGGLGGDASIVNSGGVTTFGADAIGLKAQSIGGGGGSGGAAVARTISLTPEPVPAVSISVAIGGSGGAGNTAGRASINNDGLGANVMTANHGAHALLVQSIGGGGGVGGDSTAASYSAGDQTDVTVSVSVAVGGTGGEGGLAGEADGRNGGLLITMGADAFGMAVQSIGGGGGIGGGGDASATAGEAKGSFSASIAVGGAGAIGGHGSFARGDNEGGITTGGDGADGMFVQSVGGGGGAGGGGVGTASGDNLSISVGVGGSGGGGGNGGDANAVNGGAIVTRGTAAAGLFSQSVGGGGGKAGKGGATSGGNTKVDLVKSLVDALEAGLNLGGTVTEEIDGIFEIAGLGEDILASKEELEKILKQLAGGPPYDIGQADNLDVSVGVGGKGGAGGEGGKADATNNGQIGTFGAQSDGMFVQSVGGGGGMGGAASSTGSSSDDSRNQAAIGVGGSGGAAGNGGAVSATNAAGGQIATRGVLGFGIIAQSVGGGGGAAGMTGTVAGSLFSLSVGIGGNGGAQGHGGTVTVDNAGSITTGAKHGIGILAQSIGGGGGIVRTMTTDQTFDPDLSPDNPQGRVGDVHGLTITFGGTDNPAGNGGAVNVENSGAIVTAGRTAHAIVAQSIGGGGGAGFGGQLKGASAVGQGGAGSGAQVTVSLTTGAVISTAGDGAYGILAQSIGGGGGLAGDLAVGTGPFITIPDQQVIFRGTGDGGNVVIDLSGAKVSTSGLFAPGVFAQSIGGAGGLVAVNGAVGLGTAFGNGSGGETVSVDLVATSISATGYRSPGIMLQNEGTQQAGNTVVTIDSGSSVTGGRSKSEFDFTTMVGAIHIVSGRTNSITNAGRIAGIDGNQSAVAINVWDGDTTITNSGTIIGSIYTPEGTNYLSNLGGGVIDARDVIDLGASGQFNNAGTLEVGGAMRSSVTTLTGDFVQGATGKLVVAADFTGTASDRLAIEGRADIGGTIVVQPMRVTNRPLTILTATQGVALHTIAVEGPSYGVYALPVTVVGNSLQIVPEALFAQQAAALGANQQAVAANLQLLFDGGASMDAGFAALGAVMTADQYASSLTSLSGQTVGAVSSFRFNSSQGFVSTMIDGCTSFDQPGAETDGNGCAWARLIGGTTKQDGNADSAGYKASGVTMQLGGQRPVGDNWDLGGSLAYEASRFNGVGNGSRITGDSLQGGIYARYTSGGLRATGAIDLGYGLYRSRRVISVGDFQAVATGRPKVWHAGLHGRIAYEAPLGAAAYMQPFLDGRAVHLQSDGYRENGAAPFDLAVEGRGDTALAGSIGLEVGGRIKMSGGAVLRPFASAAFEALSNDWTVTARFADQPSGPGFNADAPAPGRLGRFTVGADLLAAKNMDFSLIYTLQTGDQYQSHFGVARLTYRF